MQDGFQKQHSDKYKLGKSGSQGCDSFHDYDTRAHARTSISGRLTVSSKPMNIADKRHDSTTEMVVAKFLAMLSRYLMTVATTRPPDIEGGIWQYDIRK